MSPVEEAGVTVFILLLFFGIYCIIFRLPGTLIILIDTVAYASVTHFETIGVAFIAVLAAISLSAEGIDLIGGVAGVRRFPSSKTAFAASLAGGIAGAVILTPVFFVLGTMAGILLGSMTGLLLVEQIERKKIKALFKERPGIRAGRIVIVLLKGTAAIIMSALVLSRVYS
ncbi:MAG: DUF456 domain-containing protein [Syntrophales bacterium]|nr:DUF456 domain-containing protein [Syntrophales bacterium]MDY0043931.1 DUF456 domain-containing protein [Syntrophales bacterium]